MLSLKVPPPPPWPYIRVKKEDDVEDVSTTQPSPQPTPPQPTPPCCPRSGTTSPWFKEKSKTTTTGGNVERATRDEDKNGIGGREV